MNLPDLVILAVVEGVADVLPIDATAHALLASKIVGWRAGTIGVAIHLGAALALFTYLWRDMGAISHGLWKLRKARVEPGIRLLVKALLAAAPWIVVTSACGGHAVPKLSDLAVVGVTTIVCAILMGLADRLCMTVKRVEHFGALTSILIGLVQLAALLPGVGRVAAGLTAARVMGLERPAAYRFVLLANLPILLGMAGCEAVEYFLQGVRPSGSDILAAALTFVLVLTATGLAMPWVRRFGLLPFALYRLVLGAGLVALGVM